MKKLIVAILLILINLNNSYALNLNLNAKAYVVKDITTGKIIIAKNANKLYPPASTTKLMTLYLIYEQIEQGKFSLTDKVTISERAWKKGGSKMFLDPGSKVRVIDLIKGIAVSSGNDASIAMAEYIAGSEKEFVKLMNKKAKELGMTNTNFVNATGWDNNAHISTANDLAILGERVFKDFPKFRPIYSLKSFKHNHIRQYNKNTLLGELGVDGMKTGHVASVGYNIVTSAKKGGARYIVSVIGTMSKKDRERVVRELLKVAYDEYSNVKIVSKQDIVEQVKVFLGSYKYLDIGVNEDIYVTLTKDKAKSLKAEIKYYPTINAPVQEGDIVGKITIMHSGIDYPIEHNLVAKSSVDRVTGLSKLIKLIKYNLTGSI